MGFLDRLFNRDDGERPRPHSDDELALERYRYLLRTAPPEAIEQVHAEAFARLTPEQRQLVLHDLAAQLPEHERGSASDDPRTLARLATRAELRQPGVLERTFSRVPMASGGGPGFGSMFASSLLGSIVGYVIGSAIADQIFADHGSFGDFAGAGDDSVAASSDEFDAGDFDGGFDVSDV